MQYIMGIDPGKKGAVGLISNEDRNQYCSYSLANMTEKDLIEVVIEYAPSISHVYLEKVHSMPKQGVVSAFTFGTNFGFYQGMLLTLGLPFEFVTPRVWQAALRCLSKGDKNVTKKRAQELFPKEKITHNNADALLIAEYGRRVSR